MIDRGRRRIRQEILDHGHHDFPFVDPRRSTRPHRYGYFAAGKQGEWFWSGLVRKDMETGATQRHDFGEDQYCLEPVFAARPGPLADDMTDEPGWLLALVYDGRSAT